MWSVWADRVDLYLCRGAVWLQRAGVPMESLKVPAAMPLAGVLERVGARLEQSTSGRRLRFRVFLGASFCPPVTFEWPDELRWKDVSWVAQRQAALHWGMEMSQLDQVGCVVSPRIRGLAASMPKASLEALHSWAVSHRGWCDRIEPMWSALTETHRVALDSAEHMQVVEPDGVSVVIRSKGATCVGASVDRMPVRGDAHSVQAEDAVGVQLAWCGPSDSSSATQRRGAPSVFAECFSMQQT